MAKHTIWNSLDNTLDPAGVSARTGDPKAPFIPTEAAPTLQAEAVAQTT